MSPKQKIIPYNSNLKELARELRKNMTLTEVLLWNQLKQMSVIEDWINKKQPTPDPSGGGELN
jgi:very-short-patch-repair endonuclease